MSLPNQMAAGLETFAKAAGRNKSDTDTPSPPGVGAWRLLPLKRGFPLAHARQTGQRVFRGKDLVQVDQLQLNGF